MPRCAAGAALDQPSASATKETTSTAAAAAANSGHGDRQVGAADDAVGEQEHPASLGTRTAPLTRGRSLRSDAGGAYEHLASAEPEADGLPAGSGSARSRR